MKKHKDNNHRNEFDRPERNRSTFKANNRLNSFILPVFDQLILKNAKRDNNPIESNDWRKKQASFSSFEYLILLGTVILLLSSVVLVIQWQSQFEAFQLTRIQTVSGMIILGLSVFLLSFKLGFFSFILVNFFRYKAVKSVADTDLPLVTVIVPAYNEGKLVWETLKSLAASDFPADKMQMISIDDGSKDDTWQWMQKAKAELGDRVTILQQPKNMGKRHALYRGFNMAKGEIFVTVDSDSLVKIDTLRNLVSPFVANDKCGAVAGNVRVLNTKKGIIPRMLNVSFAFSFEFIRSAQSAFGSVLCTPGALAAYRAKAVMKCLPNWINQTFMGKPSDIGEDRAMTNMILKQGYHVLFQKNAIVLTNIPEKYKNLYKMFIRWERSNVRENIMMSKFAFNNFREGNKIGTRILLVNQWIKVIMAIPMTMVMIWFLFNHTLLFLASTFFSILLLSSIPVIFYAKRYTFIEAFWAYTYSIFYTFSLFWITPYAIATAGKRGWLTRGLQVKV